MFIVTIIVILVIIVAWKNVTDGKWYKNLSDTEKTKMKELEIRLKELNPKLIQKKTYKYTLYRELYDLSKHLVENEEVLFFMNAGVENKATDTNTSSCVYVTNKKVLAISTLVGVSKIIPFEKINSIDTGIASIIINDGSTTVKIGSGSKENLIRLREEINKGMENHKNISIHMTQTTQKDVADKIARLQVLYEDGVLTEYEFEMKKKELLDKVK